MADIVIKELKSFKELSEFINEKFTHFNSYIFRGHAEADWKLESTLARSLNRTYPNEKDIQSIIDNHLNTFKMNLRGKSKIDYKNVEEDDLWAMGQHFGLHTPLLDFTKSPYVALFFAFQGISVSGKSCIWALSERHIDLINSVQENVNLKINKIIPLTNDNPRLVSQQGLFLKIPLNISMENLITEYEREEGGVIIFKLIFDNNFKEEALLILQNMNINQLTLFPDLIGSAQHSNFQFEMSPYLKKRRQKMWEDYEIKKVKKK